ncbi:MAG TPA: hypothetical protein VF520_00570 [Thermoleophilaceae bacterium]|jgi:hypothetical protein
MTVLAIVLAAAAVTLLAALVAWLVGWAPSRALRVSATEATDRTADLAAEFWDWVRLGR